MKAVDFDDSTRTLGAPSDGDSEDYYDLPVQDGLQRMPSGERQICMVSCWEPTEEERKHIAEGGKVWMTVVGFIHPPVNLTTLRPPISTMRAPIVSDDSNGKA